jgi:hypothetical protein
VSPESSLAKLNGCDGYIAQVWTGTARTANDYEGVHKSRTFETAFLEYGAMQNLVRASGRKVWYLNDPIEDNLNRSWGDYRTNWESTLVASLLQPEVWRFEVMPWPERVFNGQYPATEPAQPIKTAHALPSTRPGDRIGIPPAYETELQAVITAMGDLKQPVDPVSRRTSIDGRAQSNRALLESGRGSETDRGSEPGRARGAPGRGSEPGRAGPQRLDTSRLKGGPEERLDTSRLRKETSPVEPGVKWEICGTQGVGVLVSDTMMFQRGEPTPSDPNLGSFYGLAMPLLKRGLPIEPVQIESATSPGFLDRYKVLLLTYEGQKPPTPEFHSAIAAWVRAGGALVVIDDDRDPYNAVREWWNTAPVAFHTPRYHLFDALGIKEDAKGLSHVGKGVVVYEPLSPATLTYEQTGAQQVRDLTHQAADAIGLSWKESNALALRRGPYLIAAGLDESVPDAATTVLHGRLISLFDPTLAVVHEVELNPGRREMLLDVDAATAGGHEGILAAACGVKDVSVTPKEIRFRATGVQGSEAMVCVAINHPPRTVVVNGKTIAEGLWRFADGLMWIGFENSATGLNVEIER